MNDFRTPGQLIRHLLESRGWDQSVLALVVGADRTFVNKVISGARAVDAKLAIALSEAFGVEPERFLELQKTYELDLAKSEAVPDSGRINRADLFTRLPVAEMIKRGWLDAASIRDMPRVEAALASFFGVDALEDIEVLPHAAKKTAFATPMTPTQIAWVYRVKRIASDMVVRPYSKTLAPRLIEQLESLLLSAEEARKVPGFLAEAGIRFVIVESLRDAKIDGVSFWLNDMSPVIGMSLRFDRIDNFWFVLRHELEHIFQRHGRSEIILDSDLQGPGTNSLTVSKEERVANAAAAHFCVPKDALTAFIARKAPFYAERDVLGFARTMRIHPGLVAGQLQHHTGRWTLLRKHLVKIRSIVRPSAMVDGWGDVAPVAI